MTRFHLSAFASKWRTSEADEADIARNVMQKRELGNSGIEIAPLIFGGNVFGWTADEKTSHSLLDAFVDAGFDCIDTANVYSVWVPGHTGGESEAIVGNVAQEARRPRQARDRDQGRRADGRRRQGD